MNSGTDRLLLLKDIDIHELLPQREPFVMVDALTLMSERQTATRFLIRSENIFVEAGRLDAVALAENMAQTCSARLGYVNKYILRRAIQIGYIGAIRNMKISRTPYVGDVLETTIDMIEEVMGMTLVRAVTCVDGQEIASAEMKIALAEETINEQDE